MLFLDVETGGLNPDTDALLTVHMSLRNPELEELKFLDLKVHPGNRAINPRALAVNKIDMDEHCRASVHPHIAAQEALYFIQQCKTVTTGGMPIVGHHVQFDIAFMCQLIPTFKSSYDRNTIDTRVLATLMRVCGAIDTPDATLQSTRLALGIGSAEDAHTARGDVESCVGIIKHLFGQLVTVKEKGFARL